MRLIHSLIASLALTGLTVAAHADTLFTYSGVFASGGTFYGTVNIDTVAGKIDGGTITVLDSGFSGWSASPLTFHAAGQDGPEYFFYFDGSGAHSSCYVDLAILGSSTTLVGYTGGSLCGGACDVNYDSNYNTEVGGSEEVVRGSIVAPSAVAATPEPSSLVLLGTGILGLAGAARRRFIVR